jgi:cell wall-associated NlpC family hydrolase
MRVRSVPIIVAGLIVALAVGNAHAAGRGKTSQTDLLSALTLPDSSSRFYSETAGISSLAGWVTAMQEQLDQVMGTVYRYGSSSSRNGFDCSGLVVYVFSKLGLPELPRSAFGMAQKGIRVEPGELQFGDLVFFNTRGRMYSHVGIYTGNGRFVHAATMNRRVMESSLSEPYYRTRYNGARRVVGVL